MTAVAWAITNWKAVVAGLVGLAAAGAVWWVMDLRLTSALSERDAARKDLATERDVRAAVEHERDRIIASMEAAASAAAARAQRVTQLREEIARAPDSDDGPVAPVLERALDGLRQPGPAAGDHHADRAAEPADVR